MGDQGKSILMDAVEGAIAELNRPSEGTVCASHHGLAKGVKVLLLCKQAEFSNGGAVNSIRLGNMTISGSMAIMAVVMAWLVAKAHGWV